MEKRKILLIEPFYTGSHKQLIDLLHKEVPGSELVTLPGKKWHWRARTSALWFSQSIPRENTYRTLFTSSVLNLAELIALRPDLAGLHKVIYFHENQLVYPVRKQQDRDFQFGYNQILSSLVADSVLFNSKFNMESFLNNINSHLKLIPDSRPKGLVELIRPKCHVLHFPIDFPEVTEESKPNALNQVESDDFSGKQIEICKSTTNFPEIIQVCKPNALNPLESDACLGKQVDICSGMSDENTELNETTKDSSQKILNKCDKKESVCNQKEPTMLTKCTNWEINDRVKSDLNVESVQDKCESVTSGKLKIGGSEKGDPLVKPLDTDGRKNINDIGDEIPAKKIKITKEKKGPLHIVWPHRWEHDKDPETFFNVLTRLHNDGLDFRISVLGELYSEVPEVFETSKGVLLDKKLHWGYLPSKQHYYEVLKSADCVVSTANHEFFGVAMLEAVHLGCYPLCPSRLVYPEIFPKECLYNTETQLYKRLREFCRKPYIPRSKPIVIDTEQFSWDILKDQFYKHLLVL